MKGRKEGGKEEKKEKREKEKVIRKRKEKLPIIQPLRSNCFQYSTVHYF